MAHVLHRSLALLSMTLTLTPGCDRGDDADAGGPVLTLALGPNTPSDLLRPDVIGEAAGSWLSVLQFRLTASEGADIPVTSVTVSFSGAFALSGGIESAWIAHDVNGNGLVDDHVPFVSEFYTPGTNPEQIFATPELVVPAGGSIDLLVVVQPYRWRCVDDTLRASVTEALPGDGAALEGEAVGEDVEYRDWCVETISEEANRTNVELLLGSDGRFRAGFTTYDGRLMFAEQTTSGWVSEVVAETVIHLTMALGSDDEPRFAWTDMYGGVHVSTRADGTWTSEDMGGGNSASIDTGADGRDHLAWTTYPGPSTVRYAVREDGSWTQSEAVPGPVAGPVSLALDPLGRPSILYGQAGNLWFAVLDGGTWTTEGCSGAASTHTLAYDSEGAALALLGSSYGPLLLRKPPGGSFTSEPLPTWTESPTWAALALGTGPGGELGISTASVGADCSTLEFFFRTPSGFEAFDVHTREYYCAGSDSAALIDADGVAWIAWPETLTNDYGGEDTALLLAHRRMD